jgi:hypothetical protein
MKIAPFGVEQKVMEQENGKLFKFSKVLKVKSRNLNCLGEKNSW